MSALPVVYILQGDDDYAIAQEISRLETGLGDPGLVAMNITRLDESSFKLDELLGIASSMPFLAPRRLVILTRVLKRHVAGPQARERLLSFLEKIPSTTTLVLVEDHLLTPEKDRRKNKLHWLDAWSNSRAPRVQVKLCGMPRGRELEERIRRETQSLGGQITSEATSELIHLVGDDHRLAMMEIHKLLAYVNYSRSIDVDDVQLLTADTNTGNIFALMDALSERNARRAMDMLSRQLEVETPQKILGMIYRQFRLLIQARELIENGQAGQVADILKLQRFQADHLATQARRFDLPTLEAVHHRLLAIDVAYKSGQTDAETALHTFVVSFAGRA